MENIFGKQQETQFVSFDEIENAFKTPTQRQADYERKPDPAPGSDDLGRLADPDGSARDPEPVPVEAENVVDREHAQKTGERIARLIDSGIDFTLSNFVARNGESYHADERDLKDIADAWGEISEEHQWNIGPEMTLVILYVMVYGPLVKQAITDRRLAAIEAEQQALKQRIAALENQNPSDHGNAEPTDTPSPEPKPSPFTYTPGKEQ